MGLENILKENNENIRRSIRFMQVEVVQQAAETISAIYDLFPQLVPAVSARIKALAEKPPLKAAILLEYEEVSFRDQRPAFANFLNKCALDIEGLIGCYGDPMDEGVYELGLEYLRFLEQKGRSLKLRVRKAESVTHKINDFYSAEVAKSDGLESKKGRRWTVRHEATKKMFSAGVKDKIRNNIYELLMEYPIKSIPFLLKSEFLKIFQVDAAAKGPSDYEGGVNLYLSQVFKSDGIISKLKELSSFCAKNKVMMSHVCDSMASERERLRFVEVLDECWYSKEHLIAILDRYSACHGVTKVVVDLLHEDNPIFDWQTDTRYNSGSSIFQTIFEMPVGYKENSTERIMDLLKGQPRILRKVLNRMLDDVTSLEKKLINPAVMSIIEQYLSMNKPKVVSQIVNKMDSVHIEYDGRGYGLLIDIIRKIDRNKEEKEIASFISKLSEENLSLNQRALRILEGGFCKDLYEVLECASMELGDLGKTYEILAELGEGGSGIVYLGRERLTNRLVALKFFRNIRMDGKYEPDKREEYRDLSTDIRHQRYVRGLDGVIRNLDLLTKHPHPAISTQIGRFIIGDEIVLAKEYTPGDNLHNLLGKLDAEDISAAFSNLLDMVKAMHENKDSIILRDIKLENILYDPKGKSMKFDDLETALYEREVPLLIELIKKLREDAKNRGEENYVDNYRMTRGSERYAAPEITKKDLPFFSISTDIYSLGACLLYLLRKKDGKPEKGKEWSLKEINSGSEECYNKKLKEIVHGLPYERFLLKALAYRPEDRFADVEDMKFAFEHNLPFDKGSLLLANWSESTNKAMSHMLAEHGFDVITATRMEDARSTYKRRKPAIVICNPCLYDTGEVEAQIECLREFFYEVMQDNPQTLFYYIEEAGGHSLELKRELTSKGAGCLSLGNGAKEIILELKEALANGKPTKPDSLSNSIDIKRYRK